MDRTYHAQTASGAISGTYSQTTTAANLSNPPKDRTSLEALEYDLNSYLDRFWKAQSRLSTVNDRLFGSQPAQAESNAAKPVSDSILGRLGDKCYGLQACAHRLEEEIQRLESL